MFGVVAVVDLFPEPECHGVEYLDEQTEFFYRQLAYGLDFWRK